MKTQTALLAAALMSPLVTHAQAPSKPEVIAPASAVVPARQRQQAMKSGVDLSRLSTSPGVHIVPLDDSPFAGPLAAEIRRDIQMQAEQGSYLASETRDTSFKAARRAPRSRLDQWLNKTYPSVESARPHLRYQPVSVSRTVLSTAALKEVYPSGKLDKGLWSGTTRTWLVAGLGEVELSETEHKKSGTSLTLIREWLNADVSGTPATLKTARDGAGHALVSLAWVTDTTSFRLELRPIDATALKTNEQAILAMANDLGD
ncbi:hypothetical protein L2Y96_19300 [Luteibacter aegosomaticola]|uniref:hypothetical protein n=1 Tax=Luteibacter aegosomaticola TaxID=2911538 RepID=UPI001FF86299|nr:hypothetical protein [Luteibacter aegosomaticola]UPG89520.1 hypothetical protein L2Y96_19300 [Luteibacter aegosomaticola]